MYAVIGFPLLFRCEAEAIGQREEHIATHIVRPRLVATIRINVVLPVVDLPQEVVAFHLCNPTSLLPRLCQRSIPVEAVVVHLTVGIASARVHLQIRIDGEVPRQLVVGIEAIVEVIHIDRQSFNLYVTTEMAPRTISLEGECQLLLLIAHIR